MQDGQKGDGFPTSHVVDAIDWSEPAMRFARFVFIILLRIAAEVILRVMAEPFRSVDSTADIILDNTTARKGPTSRRVTAPSGHTNAITCDWGSFFQLFFLWCLFTVVYLYLRHV